MIILKSNLKCHKYSQTIFAKFENLVASRRFSTKGADINFNLIQRNHK